MVYVNGIQRYCDLIKRSGGDHSAHRAGTITNIQNLNTNAGGIKTKAWMLTVGYKFPSTPVGDFKAGLDWSFTKQYVATLVFGSNGFSRSGTVRTPPTAPALQHQSGDGWHPKPRAPPTWLELC